MAASMPAEKLRKVVDVSASAAPDEPIPKNAITLGAAAPKIFARSLATGEDQSSGKTVAVARVASRKPSRTAVEDTTI